MLNEHYLFVEQRKEEGYTWQQIAEEFSKQYGTTIGGEAIRKRFKRTVKGRDYLEDDLVNKAMRIIKQGPIKVTSLARKLDLDYDGLDDLLEDLYNSRSAVKYKDNYLIFDKLAYSPQDSYFDIYTGAAKDGWSTYGIIADTHVCSTKEQQAVVHTLYDIFEEAQVKCVLHGGDLTAGNGNVYKGQISELKIFGIDKQVDYFKYTYPEKKFKTYIVSGNHDCLSKSCIPLTRRGWTQWEDVKEDDMVLGINTETGLSEWQPILRFIKKQAGAIYKFESKSISIEVTENHRHLHLKNGEYQYILTKDINKSNVLKVPVTSSVSNVEYKIEDDVIRLVGWLITDSHLNSSGYFQIYQSKEEYVEEIRDILCRLEIDFSESKRLREAPVIEGKQVKNVLHSVTFYIKASSSRWIQENYLADNKVLPSWVYDLSSRQLGVLAETILKADGSKYKNRCTDLWALYGEKTTLEQFQPLFLMSGYSCRLVKDIRKDWRLNISRQQFADMQHYGNYIEKTECDETVYCLTVPLGNFLVSHNGKPIFTGNCDAYKQSGIDIVRRICSEREDLEYLGKYGAKVKIDGLKFYIGHGDGGNPAAKSYKLQRAIDLSDEFFDVFILGHWHTFVHIKHKGTIGILPGCTEGQTAYLVRKGLIPDIGGVILKVQTADINGVKRIIRHSVEFIDLEALVK